MGSIISTRHMLYENDNQNIDLESILDLTYLYQIIILKYNNFMDDNSFNSSYNKEYIQNIYDILKYIQKNKKIYMRNNNFDNYINNSLSMINNINNIIHENNLFIV